MTRPMRNNRPRRGNMLIETAIVLAVIVLLIAIAVPTFRNRGEQARLAQAQYEITAIARTQQHLADRFGFYVPLQMLDDAALAPDRRTPLSDDLAHEPPSLHLIDAALPAEAQIDRQPTLGSDDPRVARLKREWAGPYHEFKRVYLGGQGPAAAPARLTPEIVRRDYPLDPWGQPYRFYSPLGLIGSRAGEASPEALRSDAFSDGRLTTVDDRFDAYAVVSYGPDGRSDTISNGNDDVIRLLTGEAAGGSNA